jgi:hypothetical protein
MKASRVHYFALSVEFSGPFPMATITTRLSNEKVREDQYYHDPGEDEQIGERIFGRGI